MKKHFLYIAVFSAVLTILTGPALAEAKQSNGLMAVLAVMEFRAILKYLIGPAMVLMTFAFFLAVKYQDKVTVRSTERLNEETRIAKRFQSATASKAKERAAEVIDVKVEQKRLKAMQRQTVEEPMQVGRRYKRPFGRAA